LVDELWIGKIVLAGSAGRIHCLRDDNAKKLSQKETGGCALQIMHQKNEAKIL
jgi:hypothetical protein